MSDSDTMGDIFRAHQKERQAKRASNRQSGPEVLRAAGIQFQIKNDGAHLIVQARDHVIDYWPGTGKWQTRGHRFGVVGRGVRNLVRHIKEAP